jgi:hypothetical protein
MPLQVVLHTWPHVRLPSFAGITTSPMVLPTCDVGVGRYAAAV